MKSLMIIFSILFVCIFATSCSAQDKLLRITFEQYDNPVDAENVDYFTVYKWSGDSSSVFHVDSLVLVDTIQQMITVSKFERTAWFPMDKWIRGACMAHDNLGRSSPYGFSRFYMPPERPESVKVETP